MEENFKQFKKEIEIIKMKSVNKTDLVNELSVFLNDLSQTDNTKEILFLCDELIYLFIELNNFGMIAQLYAFKSKIEIINAIIISGEKTKYTINMNVFVWFQYSTELIEKKVLDLDYIINESLLNSHNNFIRSIEYMNKTNDAVNFANSCLFLSEYFHNLCGFIEVSKMKHFNLVYKIRFIFRFLDMYILLFFNKKDRESFYFYKKESFKYINLALINFKNIKDYHNVINTYLFLLMFYYYHRMNIKIFILKIKIYYLLNKYKVTDENLVSRFKSIINQPHNII